MKVTKCGHAGKFRRYMVHKIFGKNPKNSSILGWRALKRNNNTVYVPTMYMQCTYYATEGTLGSLFLSLIERNNKPRFNYQFGRKKEPILVTAKRIAVHRAKGQTKTV